MKRNIENKLMEWKNSSRRKPLIIRGARQVGKTWSVKKFGNENFDEMVVLDFEKNRRLHSFFESDLDPKRILQDIELVMKIKITPGKTLLFLDEIQSCPDAIMSLRYFYEEMPELHVIAAGSLLEFALSLISFPVGRVQYLNMFPMTFSEFLNACGNSRAFEIVNSKPEKLPETTHNSLLSELRKYFFVGGMPESVKSFVETDQILESYKVHEELIISFKNDFSKYGVHTNPQCLEEVFVNTSKNIGAQTSYSRLSNSFSHPTIKRAFDLLLKAEVMRKVSSVGLLELPLNIQSSTRKFKTIMLDIGLWQKLSGVSIDHELLNSDLMNIYRGALAEQFIGMELAAATGDELLYWARESKSSNAEVDYVVTVNGKIFPIEVKSGSSGSLKSLHLALQTFPNIPKGLIFSTKEFFQIPDQKLMFLPLYYIGNIMNIAK
ncbi:MAG: ATP-binding protein [bacterium]